ncbi:MAG: hypothetical protein AB8B55_23700, partial [Mariniblastus sp.]
MWNEATKQLVADGKLIVIGVTQEQHAERCRLYKQWQQYDFPIVQDAFTELGLAVVPIPILIDEYGVVIANRMRRPNKISELVSQKTEAPKTTAPKLDLTFAYGNTAWVDNKLIALSSYGLTVEGSYSDGDGCLKGA